MKHPGRKALLAAAMASLVGGGLAFLAANSVSVSHAGVTTVPITSHSTNCYGPGSLRFKGVGNSTTSPDQGGIKCGAASTGQMVVTASIGTNDDASTCTDITFQGSGFSGHVDVPLKSALKPAGAAVYTMAAGETFTGSAQLTGCAGPSTLSVTFNLSVRSI